MTQTDSERRDFFRLNDTLRLRCTTIDRHLLSEDPYNTKYGVPKSALMLSELNSIEQEAAQFLSQLGDSQRPLMNYIKTLDKKIQCITHHMIFDDADMGMLEQSVDLSESGVSVYHEQPISEGSYVHLTLMLIASGTSIAVIGEVVSCIDAASSNGPQNAYPYRLGVRFKTILEQDQRRLGQHIRRRQSQLLRERQSQKDN